MEKKSLLERAEYAFLKKEYSNALYHYSLILADEPFFDEAKIGVYLSDLGLDRTDEAQALFDYYQMIKEEKKDALSIIEKLLKNLEDTSFKLQEALLSPLKEEIEYSDGISYEDFLLLVEEGSFKEVFENIMFSTKIVITNKDDFMQFVKQLASEGFEEMALNYLDSSSSLFGEDQEILALYRVLERE